MSFVLSFMYLYMIDRSILCQRVCVRARAALAWSATDACIPSRCLDC